MNDDCSLPVLLWPVSCFDRRRENPLPVYNRWYWLDWTTLTAQQTAEVLAIVAGKKRHDTHSPTGFDETVVTMSIESGGSDARMLRYRDLVTEIPENDVEAFCNVPERRNRGFHTVSVSTEYIEDENGKRISYYEMMQYVSGQEFPIIVGHVEGVLRLGPVDPTNRSEWTVERAKTIAQFLDVVQRIYRSKWHRSARFITSLSHKSGDSKLLEADFPGDEETMSILAYFRQLHASDKLLARACEAYLAHAGDARKRWWVNERKQTFESLVDSPPAPYRNIGKSRREVVRMFMYGAGLLHSSSQHGDDVALDSLIAQHGKQEVVMIFNSCLMDFYRIAATLHPVIQQDYEHWINDSGFDPPSRTAMSDLFTGLSTGGEADAHEQAGSMWKRQHGRLG